MRPGLAVTVFGLVLWLFAGALAPPAHAHPEDEFCTVGDGMDPALCRSLSQAMSTGDAGTGGTPELAELGFSRPAGETLALYVRLGFEHIIPTGSDHILFVAAIALAAIGWRSLLLQVSAFTLAHTATLGLAAAGWVHVPEAIVNPMIAASIAVIAFENMAARSQPDLRWRLPVVFVFGLFHGLGFAGTFSGLGLPAGVFWPSLIGFNIGVELGQLLVVACVLILAHMARTALAAAGQGGRERAFIIWPVSALIALTGLAWSVERILAVMR